MSIQPIERKIFISYRRSDEPLFVDRIRDWFVKRYGRKNVFQDSHSIPVASKFAEVIRDWVQQSDAVVVVIGPKWLELLRQKDEQNAERKEKGIAPEEDFVRVEVGLALQLGKSMVPICVMGALMPHKNDLPSDLQPLLEYNAAFLDGGNFLDRIDRVINEVEHSLVSAKTRKIEAYLVSAAQKSQAKDFDGAISDCTLALQLDPAYAEGYNQRGLARWEKRDHAQSIADFDEALRLNPQSLSTYFFRGRAREWQGDLKGAIADYRKYIDVGGARQDDTVGFTESWIARLQKDLKR